MAGTLQLDFLQPQSNTGLYILSPTGSTMASVNTSGIYSATGGQMFNAAGNFVNPVISTGSSLTIQTANTTAVTIDSSQNATFTGYVNAPNSFGFKNRIINGGMVIDQRNAGASVTPTNAQFIADRWSAQISQSSKFSVQQVTDAPAGFSYSSKVTSLSAYSVVSGDYFLYRQNIEGYNIADLAFGTSTPSTVTVSFWTKSSLTGSFSVSIYNNDGSRTYPALYTINSANTWEYKTVTIAGSNSGTWGTTNGIGITLTFGLGGGSTYSSTQGTWNTSGSWTPFATGATQIVGTNGATWQVTGVQLEKGSTATSFDYRPYGTEFLLCQRYYQKTAGFTCVGSSATEVGASEFFCVQMRSAPSIGQTGVLTIENMGVADITQSSTSISWRSSRYNSVGGAFTLTNFSGLTQFRPYIQNVNHNGTDNYITLSAEL